MDVEARDSSSEASYFELEPVSGAVLLDQELLRQEVSRSRGNIFTGCQRLDDHVLLGGLERSCVVGLSAEEESFGLLFGLQTIARLLTSGKEDGERPHPSAMIITTLSHAELLPTLRSAVKGQVRALHGVKDVNSRIKAALEHISISRVFDFDGLREALDELDRPAEMNHAQEGGLVPTKESDKADHSKSEPPARVQRDREIQDSEDEGDVSLSSPPAILDNLPSPNKPPRPERRQPTAIPNVPPQQRPPAPDIVLITNMAALITSLYTTRDRKHAHRMLRHLASRLRYLARSPAHGGPLILLLNSTTSREASSSSSSSKHPILRPAADNNIPRPQPQPHPHHRRSQSASPVPSTPQSASPPSSAASPPPQSPLPPDQGHDQEGAPPPPSPHRHHPGREEGEHEEEDHDDSIRSIFNPPPPGVAAAAADPGGGGGGGGTADEYGYAAGRADADAEARTAARRNRPFFGLRFAAAVGVHLLATRVARTDEDVVGLGAGEDGVVRETVWVVEVLGDEVGVWVVDPEEQEEEEEMGMEVGEGGWEDCEEDGWIGQENKGRRFNREQRWAAVEIREEGGAVRLVDAAGV